MPCQEAFQLLKDGQQEDWCSWGRTRRRSTPWPRRRWSRRGRRGRRGGECVVTLHHLSFRVQFSRQLGLKIGYPMEYPLVDHQFPQFRWPVMHSYAWLCLIFRSNHQVQRLKDSPGCPADRHSLKIPKGCSSLGAWSSRNNNRHTYFARCQYPQILGLLPGGRPPQEM